MIRVFSGGRYSFNDWNSLADILRNGLYSICDNNCDNCKYSFACREVSQAITYCDNKSNKALFTATKK